MHIPKPILFYVSNDGITEMTGEYFGVQVQHTIDIQLSEGDARKLRDMLNAKLNVEVYGAVSFRLIGKLVI